MKICHKLVHCLLPVVALMPLTVESAELLTIGSKAPALDIEHWFHDGGGKFEPVTQFKKGNIYVVEFWATWCGPCVQSMPHLAAMQERYAEKGVQIVSITDQDLATVEDFLKKPVRGMPPIDGEPVDYGQLTSAYCLTADPDRSTHAAYMDAAAQMGIPTAFIVGKQGKIQWIGHPAELESTIDQILEGKWDANAYAEQFKPKQLIDWAKMRVQQLAAEGKLDAAVAFIDAELQELPAPNRAELKLNVLLSGKRYEDAIQLIDSELKGAIPAAQANHIKLQIYLAAKQIDNAEALLSKILTQVQEKPAEVDGILWRVYEITKNDAEEFKAIIAAAITAAKSTAASANGEEKASLLDTLSNLQYVQGGAEAAIAAATEALEHASAKMRPMLENHLSELKAELGSKENASKGDGDTDQQ